MTGWTILAYAGTSLAGTLVFLSVIADDLSMAKSALENRHARLERARAEEEKERAEAEKVARLSDPDRETG